ncbi:MAG: hypothetical protein RXQ94_01305 [Caldivirga sp.]
MGLGYIPYAVKLTLSNPRGLAIFIASTLLLGLTYTWLFMNSAVGYLLFRGLYVVYIASVSLILSVITGLSLAINILAYGGLRGRGKLSIPVIVISLLPSACCTSLIPTLIALLGGATLAITTTGKIQGVLGVYDPVFVALAASLALVSLYLASRDVARGCCRVVK